MRRRKLPVIASRITATCGFDDPLKNQDVLGVGRLVADGQIGDRPDGVKHLYNGNQTHRTQERIRKNYHVLRWAGLSLLEI